MNAAHKETSRRLIPPILFGLSIMALWYGAALVHGHSNGFDVQRISLPFPHQITGALLAEYQTILQSTRQTALAALVGFLTAVAVGYLMSLVLASAYWVKQALYPWVLVLQMTPVVVLAPIFVIWLGQGLPSITAITFMISFFPVVANTTMGLISTERNLISLMRVSNATLAQEILLLRMPFALPYFLTGVKIAATLAPIGAITGDMFAGSSSGGVGGIGFMVILFNSQLKIPELFATALVACVLGFAFVGGVNLINRALLKNWHESARPIAET